MKKFSFVLTAALLAYGASTAQAQQIEIQQIPLQDLQKQLDQLQLPPEVQQQLQDLQRQLQLQPKLIGGFGDAPLLTPDGLEKLKLTAEQKDKYAKIEAEYKTKQKAAQDEYRTTIQGDRTKIREASQKLQADTKKAREDQLGKVEAILTAEQKTVFAQVRQQQPGPGGIGVRPVQPIGIGGGIGQILPPAVQNRLQLTDEQRKQLDAIQKEAEQKLMKVLTDEQRKQLQQMKKGPIIRPLPIQPANPANPVVPRVQPVVPNVQPAPAIKRD